jgi:hypothetical protein
MRPGVTKGSTLGTLLFSLSITNLRVSVVNSKYLLFIKKLKIYHSINVFHGYKLLQINIDSVQNC